MIHNYRLQLNVAIIILLFSLCSVAHAQTWQWATTQTANSQGISAISKVVPDGAGNTVVVGSFRGVVAFGANVALTSNSNVPFNGPGDIFVGRLNSAGVWTQVAQIAGLGSESVNLVDVDATGTVTVAGTFSSSSITLGTITIPNTNTSFSNPTDDIFIARLNSAGVWTQAVKVPESTFGNDFITALSVDASGTATVAGTSNIVLPAVGSLRNGNMFAGKLNSAGIYTPIIQASAYLTAYVYAATIDAVGTITLAGTFTSSTLVLGNTTLNNVSGRDIFVARVTGAGIWTWATKASGIVSNTYGATISAMAINATGAVTIAGLFNSPTMTFGSIPLANSDPTGLTTNLFAAHLNNNGVWTQAVKAGGSPLIVGQYLSLDATGTATLVGYFSGPTAVFGPTTLTNAGSGAVSYDLFIARLNSSGVWTQALRAGGTSNESIQACVIDAAGNVSISGNYESAVCSFGTIALSNTGTASTSDLFVARLSSTGTWTQATSAGGTGSESAAALAIDATGFITIGGVFNSQSVAFGATTLTLSPLSTSKALVARLSALPPANDAAVLAVYTHGKVITGSSLATQAVIRNTGSTTLTNLPVTLTVNGTTVFTDVKTIASLAIGTSTVVSFTNYSVSATGNNMVTVNVPSDAVNTNNSQSYSQRVQASIYAVADPVQSATAGSVGYSANSGTTAGSGIFAVKYTANVASVITAVNARLEGAPASIGKTVYAVLLNSSGSILSRTPDYVIQGADIGAYKSFVLNAPTPISVGDFYVGLAQAVSPAGTTPFFPLGVQTENPTRTGTFYSVALAGGIPTDIASSNLGRLMIEAVNNQALNASNAMSSAISIFPNPSNGQVMLDIHGANTKEFIQAEVSNTLGQVLHSITVHDNTRNHLDLSQLPSGLYLLQIKSGSSYTVRQLVLTK